MLINFCHPCLNPMLSCDTVCCDGYEITNLIAVDTSQQKGFLADYFIKPPMTITVKLICDVNLSHIVIYPRVGAQKSVGFEIYASQELNCKNNEEQLISIGCVRNSEDCIVFSKKRKRCALNSENIPFSQHLFFNRVHNFVSRVRTISIKVTRTLQSSIPSLKKIEIWGEPSLNCEASSKLKVERLWLDSFRDIFEEEPCILMQNSKENEVTINDSDLITPEDFVDVITNNIMALPILLPSGKVLDLSTLEKCAAVDAQSGRAPSDPFTGEMFTDQRKPVFFSALKVRIDKFLTDNAHHESVRNTSRTVGKRKRTDADTNAKKKFVQNKNASTFLCNHQSTSTTPDSYCVNRSSTTSNDKHLRVNFRDPRLKCNNPSEDNLNQISKKPIDNDETTSNDKHLQVNFRDPRLKCNNPSEDNLNQISKKPIDNDETNPVVEVICIDELDAEDVIDLSDDSSDSGQNGAVNKVYTSTSHNVDAILQKTLAGLPSFTRPVSSDVLKEKLCYSCSSTSNLYRLPCSHFYCRPCLLSNTKDLKVLCQNCKSEFSSSDPVRFHQ